MMWMFAESFTEEYEELEALKKELNEEEEENWKGYCEWLDSLGPDYMPCPEDEE